MDRGWYNQADGVMWYHSDWYGFAPDDFEYEIREYECREHVGEGKKSAKYCIVITGNESLERIWCQTNTSALKKLASILKVKYPGTDWEGGWGCMPEV